MKTTLPPFLVMAAIGLVAAGDSEKNTNLQPAAVPPRREVVVPGERGPRSGADISQYQGQNVVPEEHDAMVELRRLHALYTIDKTRHIVSV